ncbi:S-type anion channel SLAH1 [Bienertia sinuspersici]
MDSKLGANNKVADIEVVIDDDVAMSKNEQNNKKIEVVGIYDQFVSTTLANFHAGYFRISLGLSAQVWLWKTLVQFTKDSHDHGLHPVLMMLPSTASTLLWSLALVVLITLSILYALRCLHHFDKVKEEYVHHIGVNYLFAPWMSCLLLLQTSPILVVPSGTFYQQITWWMLVAPIVLLDIKMYGQWFIKGKARVLAKVANPASQLSVIANFIAAKASFFMGWSEIALCFFAMGVAHYLVLFVTLYQRHPGSNGVSPKLRPVFSLFVATPSMASLAWSTITGSFDITSKMFFFLSMFLFISLVCRPTLFKKSMRKFSVAWWSFSFPLTLLALASIGYAQEVKHGAAKSLALSLSIMSMIVSLALTLFTTLKVNNLFLTSNNNKSQS